MDETQIAKLALLREAYHKIRNEKLATGITIHTLSGDFHINNGQIVTAVLDFLIHEVNAQIRNEVNG